MTDPHEVRALVKLWQSVVLQVIRDAHAVNTCGDARVRRNLEAVQARRWPGTRSFAVVCALAGVDPVKVRAAIEGPKPAVLDQLVGKRSHGHKGRARA